MTGRRVAGATLISVLLGGTALAAPPGTNPVTGLGTGPSSSQTPYLQPTNQFWTSTALLTVGDGVGGYNMAGIPDGLGAFDNGDRTITVLMNHELGPTQGATHAHGSVGAFVSKWVINKDTLQVVSGGDLIQTVQVFNPATGTYSQGTTAFARLCSADLPAVSALYNAATGNGFNGRIFMNGEETGAEGRAFGTVVTGGGAANGTAFELPKLGKFSWENSLANPNTGDKTVVIGTDDSTPGQLYFYVGDKQKTGTPVEQAGLTNGKLYGIAVTGVANEARGAPIPANTAFTLVKLGNDGDVSSTTGAALQTDSVAKGVTNFLRPEDGAWDPKDKNVFYFVTTDRIDTVKEPGAGTPAGQVGRSRLWKLTFTDAANPDAGGKIEALLDGTEAGQMFDNMTVGSDGKIYLQEDVGGVPHLGKIYVYDPATDTLTEIFEHDPARFGDIGVAATAPFNNDEESSGVIDVTDLFRDAVWFDAHTERVLMADVQAHYALSDPALVQGGQLLLLAQVPEPATIGLLAGGLVGLGALRRRRRKS